MADLLTTLHPINDDTTDLYPNVKRDNLPQNVKDELDAIPNKVDKVQGKGLSTNDFTNADKALVDTIPDKVDKEQGKGLSTNDFTNADKALVDTIPDKVNKEQGKGLSTNDYTNADKNAVEIVIPSELSSLRAHILNLYRMVIRSGGMITVTDASVALASQPFPLTVSPKALLNYIGGMCQKIGNSIVTAPVTMVVSKGFNLWDEEWEVGRYDTTTGEKIAGSNNNVRNKNPIAVLPNSTCYFKATAVMTVVCYDSNDNVIGVLYVRNETKALPVGCSHINFFMASGYGTTYKHDICINVSNASLNGTYMPYRAPIYYPIHPDIQALEGYGLGKDAEHYNYIDLNRKMFVKETAIDGDDIIVLATPVETDISDLLKYTFPTYDIINVMAGGYLEFENENNIGVPYSVTYQSKPNTQATVLSTAQPTISEVDSNDPTNPL